MSDKEKRNLVHPAPSIDPASIEEWMRKYSTDAKKNPSVSASSTAAMLSSLTPAQAISSLGASVSVPADLPPLPSNKEEFEAIEYIFDLDSDDIPEFTPEELALKSPAWRVWYGIQAKAAGNVDDTSIIEQALAEDPTAVNEPDKQGYTPLMQAISIGEIDVVKILVEAKANMDHVVVKKKGNPETVFIQAMAVEAGEPYKQELIEYLLSKRANPEIPFFDWADDYEDWVYPVTHAAKRGYNSIVETLLRHGASDKVITKNGFTLLHFTSDPKLMARLIAQKADVNVKSKPEADQSTPLHHAVTKSEELTRLLLENKASYTTDKDGLTPYQWAEKTYKEWSGYEDRQKKFEAVKTALFEKFEKFREPVSDVKITTGRRKRKEFDEGDKEGNLKNKSRTLPEPSSASGGVYGTLSFTGSSLSSASTSASFGVSSSSSPAVALPDADAMDLEDFTGLNIS